MSDHPFLGEVSPGRRRLLKSATAWAAGTGAALPLAISLQAFSKAAYAAEDYKSLICFFLYGGNDHANTVVPYSQPDWDAYIRGRSGTNSTNELAGGRARADLLPISASSVTSQQLALPKELGPYRDAAGVTRSGLHGLYGSGRVAIVANVGALVQPTTKIQFDNGTVALPPQLFSHNDNQNYWQTSVAASNIGTGWGGRMADVLSSLNAASPISMCMSLYGANLFETGSQTSYFPLTDEGIQPIEAVAARYRQEPRIIALNRMLAATDRRHLFEQIFAQRMKRAVDAEALAYSALSNVPSFSNEFRSSAPDGNFSMAALRTVARMIAARKQLGQRRQVFFVGLGGFDTHANLDSTHPVLLTRVNEAFTAMHDVLVGLNMIDSVVMFSASDFGRCLTTNNRGSDHGWGGHHFVMGGPVRGGQVYGKMNQAGLGGPEDAGQGRLIPTTSVDEYAAGLARWFGVSQSDLPFVLPNLSRFSTTGLGFI